MACTDPQRVLRVGTSGDYAPFSLDGEGFDIEVARLLAAELDARIEWVPFLWPALAANVATNRFDVAMSGVTWRPERAVVGWMTRAVASGGPCVLGDPEPERLGVNEGGILERWARQRFSSAEIRAVADNRSLPELLVTGEVDAIVTDSFELAHFRRPNFPEHCEPASERKVYWVTPAAAPELGPAIDRFLREREAELDALRERHFGRRAERAEVDHLIDLLARRLALMPAVAAWKRELREPISDPAREELVLARAAAQAHEAGIEIEAARRLFEIQIELAKAVQGRALDAEPLDLERELRPALLRLGDRIVASLARAAPLEPGALAGRRLAPLASLLEPNETELLRRALLDVRPAP
ncbi:MAG: transporter substrate-binding domain-containing protein [Myxococcota bacterium]